MDNILVKRREAFFNNLVLLGLDKVALEKEYGILFHMDMFMLPNKKGYEVVTYFLFLKLSAVTAKDYNLPWPLFDKEHDRTFQKTCYCHLMNFSEENLVKFPRIIPSLISTFGGDRFYEVYLAFSSYVLSKTLRNNNIHLLSRPFVTQENFAAAKHNLQLSTLLCVQKFRDTEIFTHDSHLIWTAFSKNLQEYLYKLKKSLETSEVSIKEKQKVISSLYSCENFTLKETIEKCFECWKPLLKQRKNLEFFFSSEKKFWDYLASEVGENVENYFLNGQDYNICIPDNLPEECRKKLEKVGFTSSQENGKLSIVRFMKLFLSHLIYIAGLLSENDLSELHGLTSCVDATSLQDDLHSANDLYKKLNGKVIPLMEENIKNLKLLHHFDDPDEEIKICTPLPILSFNPGDVKERTSHFYTEFLNKQKNFCCQNSNESALITEKIFCSENFNDSVFITKKNFFSQNYNDSVFNAEKDFCSQISNDSVFITEKKSSPELSFINLNNVSTSDSPFLATAIPNTKVFASNDEEISLKGIHSRKFNVPFKSFQDTGSKLSVSALDDIDFAPSTHFKMRNSWLNEESLNTVTLPDISFDE